MPGDILQFPQQAALGFRPWDAANLEELWQAELWGKDYQAVELRARRRDGFLAAARFAALARGDGIQAKTAS